MTVGCTGDLADIISIELQDNGALFQIQRLMCCDWTTHYSTKKRSAKSRDASLLCLECPGYYGLHCLAPYTSPKLPHAIQYNVPTNPCQYSLLALSICRRVCLHALPKTNAIA